MTGVQTCALPILAAFTAGVVVNVIIGYVLSVHVFANYWNGLGG